MKIKRVYSKTVALVLILFLVVALMPLNGFKAYATNSFSNFELSSDGGVLASYNDSTKKLIITGSGTIEYDKWKAMAQIFNPMHFTGGDYNWGWKTNSSFGPDLKDFDIIFDGDSDESIKLCGSGDGGGLFQRFGSTIKFNKKVTLAPTATDLTKMFDNAIYFNEPINNWDVSHVTNMDQFLVAAYSFNQPLDNWDVSNVTNMFAMFYGNKEFNQPIGNWDVSNVTNMSDMFFAAEKFNQPIGNWDVSNVTDMSYMLSRAEKFNQPIDNWNVSNVTNMSRMFEEAYDFNQPLNSWNVSKVTTMYRMFRNAFDFNQPLDNWDASSLLSTEEMFESARSFNGALNGFNVSNIKSMKGMFLNAEAFNQPLDNWNVSNVINMRSLFNGAKIFNQPLNSWDVSNVINMDKMFYGAKAFNQPIDNWNVSNVTSMHEMFYNASAFDQPLETWDISKVDNLYGFLNGATSYSQPVILDISSSYGINGAFDEINTPVLKLKNDGFDKSAPRHPNKYPYLYMEYLEFSGLEAHTVLGGTFTGDYVVEDVAAKTTTDKLQNDSYVFDANKHYKAYLQGPKHIHACDITPDPIPDQYYTGSPIEPSLTLTDSLKGITLAPNSDYSITYENNTNLGRAKITITGLGPDYRGTRNEYFNIITATIDISDIDRTYQVGQTTSGALDLAPLLPSNLTSYTVNMGTIGGSNPAILADGVNAPQLSGSTLSYQLSGNGMAGDTAIIPMTVSAPHFQDKIVNLIITLTQQISNCTVDSIDDQAYTGNPITPPLVVRDGSYQLIENTDYTVNYQNNTAIGTAKAIISGTGSYLGNKNATFEIVADASSNGGNGAGNTTGGAITGGTTTGGAITGSNDDDNGDNAGNNGDNNSNTGSDDGSSIGLSFSDVLTTDWFSDAVDYVVQNELMNGIGNGLFDPNGPTTRAMGVTIIYRLAGEPAASSAHNFNDVSADSWYYDAVNWASQVGVVKGFPDGDFKPNLVLTREQLVALLFRYANHMQYDTSGRNDLRLYSDLNMVSPYALAAKKWAVHYGFINGINETLLAPQGGATRAQLAAILQRFDLHYDQ